MRALFAVLLCFLLQPAHATEPPTYDSIMSKARAAFEAEDWRSLAAALDAAQTLRPYSLYLTRNRILAYALLENFDEAEAIAGKAAERGLSLKLEGHPGFDALIAQPAFTTIAKKMKSNLEPIGDAIMVIEHGEDGWLPESYARGEKRGQHFIGSVRSGRIVDASGVTFATAPGGVYGMEIIGGDLWTVANSAPPYESAGETSTAGFYVFDLKTGEKKQSVMAELENALLGDLEATPLGVIASDSVTPRLFTVNKDGAGLRVLAEDPRFVNLQGIAYDKKRRKLYVADYLVGLFSVDVASGAVAAIANSADAFLGGIDGLYLYKGDLIGIQNGATPQRIARLTLNKAGDSVEALNILQRNLPDWREPTNGQVVGSDLLYVATSNWPAYGQDGTVDETVERAPVRIMIAPLD